MPVDSITLCNSVDIQAEHEPGKLLMFDAKGICTCFASSKHPIHATALVSVRPHPFDDEELHFSLVHLDQATSEWKAVPDFQPVIAKVSPFPYPYFLAIPLWIPVPNPAALAVRVLSVPCSFSDLNDDQTESDADFFFIVARNPKRCG